METPSVREQCYRIMHQVLKGNDWQLVTYLKEESFLDEVVVEALKRAKGSFPLPEKSIRNAITNRYCQLWYQACTHPIGPIRSRAFLEMYNYMFRTAYKISKYNRQLAEDAAQEAVTNVWQHLNQLKDPGKLMGWARRIVRNETLKQIQKLNKKKSVPQDMDTVQPPKEYLESSYMFDGDGEELIFYLQVQETISRHEPEMRDQLIAELKVAIRSCLRSKKQQEAIIRCFFSDQEHGAIAHDLGITPENLSVFKSHALANLRKCKPFIDKLYDSTQN